jgi:ornithine decarboxylase
MYDLVKLNYLYEKWTNIFPDIHPYYAVKCNPESEVLRTLEKCGVNFDCASTHEIDLVLNMNRNVNPNRIIYANPCKSISDIDYAYKKGVRLTTIDSICELDKLRAYPDMKIVLRIYACDASAKCLLSSKYGAKQADWDSLLTHAYMHGQKITGISFHIGSGASNPVVFYDTLRTTRLVFDKASALGFSVNLIDIGGGFTVSNIDSMSPLIYLALNEYFPSSLKCSFIAEPGRYFAETIARLYTKVIGVRESTGHIDYTVTDGLYGSFNCILYDHAELNPVPICLNWNTNMDMDVDVDVDVQFTSTIWGPTCDSMDKICSNINLPHLYYGDWLQWDNMGAYTIAGACDFNGINLTRPLKFFIRT